MEQFLLRTSNIRIIQGRIASIKFEKLRSFFVHILQLKCRNNTWSFFNHSVLRGTIYFLFSFFLNTLVFSKKFLFLSISSFSLFKFLCFMFHLFNDSLLYFFSFSDFLSFNFSANNFMSKMIISLSCLFSSSVPSRLNSSRCHRLFAGSFRLDLRIYCYL